MAKLTQPTPFLLHWSQHVPMSDVQDPLGLGLRGSTRLASLLLFCITSITPRARYFSFIPWCVYDWQKRERGQNFAFGLRDAIAVREKALALGCIGHHEGRPCNGGGLVGSDNVAKWFQKGQDEIDLRKLPFAKNPALGAYFNSLVNLGFFVTDDDTKVSDEDEEEAKLTFDDLSLSPLGKQLADSYESLIGRLESVRNVSAAQRRCSVRQLKEWGKRGGLCELSEPTSTDRDLLRDIFFARTGLTDASHAVRNRSLSLILELARQLSAVDAELDEPSFAAAVYYGEIYYGPDDCLAVEWPESIRDIAMRWRMFYFHHFMSVALEGMFSWVVTQASEKGLKGVSVDELANVLDSATVPKALKELVELDIPSFGSSTPSALFRTFAGDSEALTQESSRHLDAAIRPSMALCEERLEEAIRQRTYLRSPSGLAVPMLLLGQTLARYAQWEDTNYGNWLGRVARDSFLDLVPPLVSLGLNRHFGTWWTCPWKELAEFVLSRYVVQQHQSMSYERTAKGDRCLFDVDAGRITTRPNEIYEKIGLGNPRFGRAVQILTDLGLLVEADDGTTPLTIDGKRMLNEELAKERQA